MRKDELIQLVASKLGGTKTSAKKAVDAVFESVKEGISQEGNVIITGFGKFEKKTKKARIGRNPATGESIQIPEKQVLTFKPYSW